MLAQRKVCPFPADLRFIPVCYRWTPLWTTKSHLRRLINQREIQLYPVGLEYKPFGGGLEGNIEATLGCLMSTFYGMAV